MLYYFSIYTNMLFKYYRHNSNTIEYLVLRFFCTEALINSDKL